MTEITCKRCGIRRSEDNPFVEPNLCWNCAVHFNCCICGDSIHATRSLSPQTRTCWRAVQCPTCKTDYAIGILHNQITIQFSEPVLEDGNEDAAAVNAIEDAIEYSPEPDRSDMDAEAIRIAEEAAEAEAEHEGSDE